MEALEACSHVLKVYLFSQQEAFHQNLKVLMLLIKMEVDL
jgi:hypothetical protein